MTHRNAPLTPQGRYRLVMPVQSGRPIAHVAAEAGIAHATLSKWVARYRQKGISELEDRSSAPFHCPTRTSAETVGSTHFEHGLCLYEAARLAEALIGSLSSRLLDESGNRFSACVSAQLSSPQVRPCLRPRRPALE